MPAVTRPAPRKVAELLAALPDSDNPGKESKFTGPDPETARKLVEELLEGGREALLDLIGRIGDAVGGGEEGFRPGYLLHAAALHVSAAGREAEERLFTEALASRLGKDGAPREVQKLLARELAAGGGEGALEALGALLEDDDLCEPAAQALVSLSAGAAALGAGASLGAQGAARLLAALEKARGNGGGSAASGKRRLAIAHALGALGDPRSAGAMRGLLEDADVEVREAAFWGLARAAAALPPAEHAGDSARLLAHFEKCEGWERIQATKSVFALAEGLKRSGDVAAATAVYVRLKELAREPAETYLRAAAEAALAGG
jgi:hypothetical protein